MDHVPIRDSSLTGLISRHATARPDALAATCGDKRLTYEDLESASSKLALLLHTKGVRRGHRVVVLTTRCLEIVVLFCAVLKTGACYVPLDRDNLHSNRISHVVRHVQSTIALVTGSVPELECPTLSWDEVNSTANDAVLPTGCESPQSKLDGLGPEDLAYIIFTSGTTSSPKGVMVPHRAILNYVQQGSLEVPFNMRVSPSDKVLLIFSPAFDACTGVIFSTLCNGGALIIADTDKLDSCLRECSILPCTPSILRSISIPERYDNVRAIFLGGEAPTVNLISAWSNSFRNIYNCYGPSETTCASLIAEVLPGRPITLGHPMPNSRILLFNDARQPCEEGEIWICGPGLATGYLNDESLTRAKFIYHEKTRFYRTGDYAKRQQGELFFLGRGDSMIKNRGFLVNVETEVIPAICSQNGVDSAIAFQSNGKLFAFVTPASCKPHRIRLGIAQTYDSFLVPDHIYCLNEFPLTSNGKVDVQGLCNNLAMFCKAGPRMVESTTANATTLKSVVAKSLGLDIGHVDENSSFWELGGNSLSAIQVLTSLRSYNLSTSISQLLGPNSLISLSSELTPCQHLVRDKEQISSTRPFPITAIQERMLSASLRCPIQSYMVLSMEIPTGLSDLQASHFRRSGEILLKRHSVLTSSFDLGEHSVQIADHLKLDWQTVTVTTNEDWEFEHRRQMHHLLSRMQASDPFSHEAIFRLMVEPGHRSQLLWLVHHSRIDGWSMKILIEEWQAILDGRALPDAPQFFEVALIRKSIDNTLPVRAHSFWNAIMEKQSKAKSLGFPRNAGLMTLDDTYEAHICSGLSVKHVQATCRQFGVSSSAAFYGAWALLLMHYSGSDTASFGAVFSGRNLPMNGADRVVGPMINVCPFPVQVDDHCGKIQWLQSIQLQINQMSDMQWSADHYISQSSRKDRPLPYDTLVSVQFDASDLNWCCEAIPTPWKLRETQISEFPWTLLIETDNHDFKFRLLYQPTMTSLSLTTRAVNHFKNILLALLDPELDQVHLVQKKLLSTLELQALAQKDQNSATPPEEQVSIKKAFESAAHTYVDLVALESLSQSMTYRDLEVAANALSWELMPSAGPGKTVAILSDGSLNWIISIIAVIKTGAVYCPIDVNQPKLRAGRMLLLSGASVLIAPEMRYFSFLEPPKGCRKVVVHDVLEAQSHARNPLPDRASLEDPVYLIFTSGTSGTPKGVRANSRGLLSYISYGPARLHAAPGRRIAQMFSVGFDACAAEVFGTLCYGGTLLLKYPDDFLGNLRTANAAMMTPSFLSACDSADFPNLETIVLGGEVVPQDLADAWSNGRRLYNGYGPCECTVGSIFSRLTPGLKVTLGRPIPGMSAYILNETRALVPVGIAGEIYLTGCQVTGSYFICDEKDQDRFLPDPWRPGQTMFRTGDSGRWTESMEVDYLGRLDRQVKIRGFRINLEEVETAIRQSSPGIKQVAVVVSNGSLLACICPEDLEEGQIMKKLRALLPHFSLPSRFAKLGHLPLSANQKVDYKALAEWQPPGPQHVILPSMELPRFLAQVWKEILQHQQNSDPEISLQDDFLQLGGHSLLQLQLARKLSAYLKCTVPLKTVILNTVLSDQAEALRGVVEPLGDPRPRRTMFLAWKRNSAKTLETMVSSREEEMIALTRQHTIKSAFNMPCLFQIKGAIDITHLASAIRQVLLADRTLRSRYRYSDRKLVRHVSDTASLLEIRTVNGLERVDFEADVNRPFNHETDQLLRILLFQTNTALSYLLVIAHHSIMDGTSLNLFFRSIQERYEREIGHHQSVSQYNHMGKSTPPTERHDERIKADYLDFLNWRASVIEEPPHSFWREYLSERTAPFLTMERTSSFENREGFFTKAVPQDLVQAMASTCAKQHISEQQMMLASMTLTVSAIYGVDDIVIAIPFSDRNEPGTERILGLLLDRLPIRLQLGQELKSRDSFLTAVKSSNEQALANAMPYLQILETLSTAEPLFDLMMSYHPRGAAATLELPGCTVSSQRLKARGAKFPCTFEAFERDDGVLLDVEYMAERISSSQIATLAAVFEKALELLCRDALPSKPEPADSICDMRGILTAFVDEIRSTSD